mmetsp:Transcript_15297/g.37934  ORF Transcript_15297/g.37934 Transcript_15297/m.37934 type:complete len:411 (-) Transcript_15297:259-1491(-)
MGELQDEHISGFSGFTSVRGEAHNSVQAGEWEESCAADALPNPDDADLERLGQEWRHVQAHSTEDGAARHAVPNALPPPAGYGAHLKVAAPPSPSIMHAPPPSAALQRQGSGGSVTSWSGSLSPSGSGGGQSAEQPAALGKAATTSARRKKRPGFTSPYHEFCKERRPLLPAGLSNSEREKLLGMAWKAHLAQLSQVNTQVKRLPASMPAHSLLAGRGHVHEHGCNGISPMPAATWDHRTLTLKATHAPAPPRPQLSRSLSAPPALQPVLAHESPAVPAPQWIKVVVTEAMLRGGQIILEQKSGGEALCFAVPPEARPGESIIVNLPPGVVQGQILRVHCQPPPPSMSLQTLSRAPELRHMPLELLTAAATHRTGVEHYLDQQTQQHLADEVDDLLTGEEALELAMSLGI